MMNQRGLLGRFNEHFSLIEVTMDTLSNTTWKEGGDLLVSSENGKFIALPTEMSMPIPPFHTKDSLERADTHYQAVMLIVSIRMAKMAVSNWRCSREEY
jgi:hypothetical protein